MSMDKVTLQDGQSADIISENIEKLKEIFPDAFSEGSVNFDALRQLMGDASVLDEGEEKYGLQWHGKKKARQIALTPSTGTLLPCPEESVDWDATRNLFIEGDNLEAMKLLRKSYAGGIKMIYIDPPYNTGGEFIYPDKFQENLDTYLRYTGQVDDEGIKLASNTEAGGRKHTNWLNMMFSRLKASKDLLAPDGIVFISIDINELANLTLLGKEVFGAENFVGMISRSTGTRMGTGSRGIARELDYIVAFSKSASTHLESLPMTDEELGIYNQEDDKGLYLTRSLRRTGGENRREDRPSMFYPVISPEGDEVYPMAPEGYESRWVCGKDTYAKLLNEGFIEWKKVTKDGVERWQVYQKHYVKNALKESSDLWSGEEGNKKATKELSALFDRVKIFDHPKPISLMRKVIQLGTRSDRNDIVLDFFAGSATTAQAVLEQNALDGGNRRFIMIQLPEKTDPKTEAHKSGFANIAQLGRERVRRASEKIHNQEASEKLDLGFKSFCLSHSNIRVWAPDPTDIEETLLSNKDHLVDGRSEEDVLYELLLKRGVELTVPIERRVIGSKTIHSIGYGVLFACLDTSIKADDVDDLAQAIIEWHKELDPETDTHVFFRDSAFADDITKTNMAAILEQNGISHVRSL